MPGDGPAHAHRHPATWRTHPCAERVAQVELPGRDGQKRTGHQGYRAIEPADISPVPGLSWRFRPARSYKLQGIASTAPVCPAQAPRFHFDASHTGLPRMSPFMSSNAVLAGKLPVASYAAFETSAPSMKSFFATSGSSFAWKIALVVDNPTSVRASPSVIHDQPRCFHSTVSIHTFCAAGVAGQFGEPILTIASVPALTSSATARWLAISSAVTAFGLAAR